MASPRHVSGLSPGAAAGAHHMLLEAAYNDNLRGFKNLANMLDTGRGCLRETVGEARQAGVQGMEGAGVLHLAAINGSMNVVREDTSGFCCTQWTHRHGQLLNAILLEILDGFFIIQDGTMKILLDHKADYNKMVLGMTPLFVAINHASEKCAKLLVKAGADINGDYVLTALTDTSSPSSTQCLHCLLEGFTASHHVADNGAPVSRSITELKSLGSMAFQSKNYLHAAGFYSKAMDLDPDDATLFSNRSLCWLRRGHGGKALLDAHECRKKQPDWSKACYRLGASLMSLKDYGSACDALFDGLKLDPADVQIENALREAFQNLKLSRSTKAK
ncbi:uncharacterized protein LOC127782682 isoform X1 [Oryza glaberrima]|uniref:uncharacterized protein LOC127782682 isoform X1 n=1 Tax=Oryza glaberrima TaxID=4538 RepID=UPI00224C485C|nr:uncharacterized protein LOC127782682 isoform X1 [Oryza glaberrima]